MQDWILSLPPFAHRLLERPLAVDRLAGIYSSAELDGSQPLFDTLGDRLSAHIDAQPETLDHILSEGPIVVLSTDPFGMLHGVALGAVLARIRPTVTALRESVWTRMFRPISVLSASLAFCHDPAARAVQAGEALSTAARYAWPEIAARYFRIYSTVHTISLGRDPQQDLPALFYSTNGRSLQHIH